MNEVRKMLQDIRAKLTKHKRAAVIITVAALVVIATITALCLSQCSSWDTVSHQTEDDGNPIGDTSFEWFGGLLPNIKNDGEGQPPAEEENEPSEGATDSQVGQSAAPGNNTSEPAANATQDNNTASSNNQPNTSSGNSDSTSSGESAPAPSAPEKHWAIDYEQVWVEDSPAWTESVPIYGYEEQSICNICNQVITGNEAAHGKAHMVAGEGSGHHTEYKQVITGYNTISHPAEGHYSPVESGGIGCNKNQVDALT